MTTLKIRMMIMVVCLLQTAFLWATSLPKARPVHIEVRFEPTRYLTNRYMYFWLIDLYTKEEKKIGSEFLSNGVQTIDFELYHPLYDELIPSSNARIPFYVEPGDTLIIHLGKNGKDVVYERKDRKPAKYENLLRNDISNREFYSAKDFEADKERCRFPEFVKNVVQKMNVALDSVNAVADRHGFSSEERNLALCNTRLQFALWIFEYAPSKTSELNAYSQTHTAGWQALPEQDAEQDDIQDINNYAFMRTMHLSDSSYLASRILPRFIQSYEHSQVLNSDQYLYYGDTSADYARMDSAFIAKDLAMTKNDHPSLFMHLALARRHFLSPPPTDDNSIHLQEVQVVGDNLTQFYNTFGTPKDYDPQEVVERAWAHDVNLRGPISSLLNRKKIKNYKRARRLIKQLGQNDEEREAMMKAYEEMMERERDKSD